MKKKVSTPQVGYSQVRQMLAKGFSRANPFFFYIVCNLLGNPLGKWANVLDRSHEGSSHRVPPTDSEGGHHLDTVEEVGEGGQGSPWLFLEFSFEEETGIFQRCLPAGLCFPRFLDYRQQAFLGGGLLFFFGLLLLAFLGYRCLPPRLGYQGGKKNNSWNSQPGCSLRIWVSPGCSPS